MGQGVFKSRAGAGAGFSENPGALEQIASGQLAARSPGMVLADHDDQLVAGYRNANEAIRCDSALDETKLHRSILDGRGDLRCIADFKLYRDERIALVERDQMPGEPIAGDGLAGLHGQPATFQSAEVAERKVHGLDLGENATRLDQ